jgi:hypothetical protein
MPRRSRKTENSAGAPLTALKPERKAAARKRPRAAAGQRGTGRTSSRRDPVPAQLLFLPTRPRYLFLTRAGPAPSGRATRAKTAIDLPSVIVLPYLPAASAYDRAAEQERVSAVAGIAAVASPVFAQIRSLPDRLHPLSWAWRWAKARAAAAPRSILRSLRTRVLLSVPRLFAIDPHTAAVVAVWSGLISGALVTGVLVRARTQLLQTEALMARQAPQPAHQPNAATQDKARNKKKDGKAVQDGVVIEHWIEPGKTIQAQQSGPAVADIRIVDAPARMKRSCYEQIWPYIAAHCLTVAEDSAAVAAGPPVAVTVTPLPSLAVDDASTTAPAQPVSSAQHAAEITENEVTGNTDRHHGSARRFKPSMHRAVASATQDDSSPMPEKSRPVRTRHAQRDFQPHRDRAQSVARSQPVRENSVISGPPPYLSFNAY